MDSGLKIFDPGWVNLLLLGLSWVSHLWFRFGPGKFPLRIPNFPIFAVWVKKFALRQVKKYPGQIQVRLLFYAGPKYARVGSGAISSC